MITWHAYFEKKNEDLKSVTKWKVRYTIIKESFHRSAPSDSGAKTWSNGFCIIQTRIVEELYKVALVHWGWKAFVYAHLSKGPATEF